MAFQVCPRRSSSARLSSILLAFLFDVANIDWKAVNILRKYQLVTLRDFSNFEQELPQVRAILGQMFGIMADSDVELKLQLSRAIGVWQISRMRISERDAPSCNGQSSRKYRRDQREITQTSVPHFQHGQGQGAGRHEGQRTGQVDVAT